MLPPNLTYMCKYGKTHSYPEACATHVKLNIGNNDLTSATDGEALKSQDIKNGKYKQFP